MSKKGFAPVVVILVIAALALVPLLQIKTTSDYSGPAVEGVLIAKGGDDSSGGSSGGGDSGGGSHNSGGSSGGSGSSGGANTSTSRVEVRKPEKIEKLETKTELEVENEIENEVEKPEVERVDVKVATAEALEVEIEGTRSGNRKATASGISVAGLRFKSKNGEIEFASRGVSVHTNFPLTFNKTTNQLFVNTPNGPRLIRVLPDQASEIAQAAGVQSLIEKVELNQTQTATGGGGLTFKLTGKKTGILLGLVPVNADVETQVDAETGAITSVSEPLWFRLLSGLVQ